MAFITYLGRVKINFQNKIILPTPLKNPPHKLLKILLLLGLNRQQKPQVQCFKCLGFGHIAANCPTKRTMMVKGGLVVSDYSDQSSRSNSPSPSKAPSENECELPCEDDLLVVRRMLGTIPKPLDETQRKNIFHTRCLINKLCSMIIDGVVVLMWQLQE